MYYTQTQIDRANEVNLEDFLRSQGETLIRSGREYRWKAHDSLTVHDNKWFRHSQSKGGFPIDFVMEFYGKSFPDAIQMLTGEVGAEQNDAPDAAPPAEFHLPLYNQTADNAIQYLTNTRGLNRKLVEAFLISGDIYEDARNHNVVFVGRDRSGIPRYAHLFMGVLHFGPAGAALGTTLSQAISVIVSLTVILKRKSIVLKKEDFKPCCSIMGKILKIGVPIAFQDGLIQIAFIVITIIANQRGLNEAAAVGIVEKVMSFLFLIPSSMLSTVSALGAQNIGAGKSDRAIQTLRYAVMLAVGFGILASITIQFTAEPIVALFTDPSTADGAAVIRFGGQYLRGYIFDCIFAGIHFSFSGYFCACGKSGLSFLHNILAIALVRIPGVYLTSKLFPATLFPMGLATATGSLLSVVICILAFTVVRHKDKQVSLGG